LSLKTRILRLEHLLREDSEQEIQVPRDPQKFYEDFGFLTHPRIRDQNNQSIPVTQLTPYQCEFWKYPANALAIKSQKIGLTLNLAAQMEAICGINQIVIGDNVYQKLDTTQKKNFKKVPTKRWKYYHIEHNRSYPVYESL